MIFFEFNFFGNPFNWGISCLQAAAAVATIIAAFIAIFTLCFYKRQFQYKLFYDMLEKYNSPEMFEAVIFLKNFKHRYGKDKLVSKYRLIRAIEKKKLLAGEIKPQEMLHYKRKLVSTFYRYLAQIHYKNYIPKNVIFAHFNLNDLEIIRQILNPIEKAFPNAPEVSIMMKLYYACKEYYEK